MAFTKRLVNVSIQLQSEQALILLTSAKSLLGTFAYTDVLLDTECVGSGVYRPDLDEPEYCNSHNSHILYELHLLLHHDNDAVKQCAKLLLKASAEHQPTHRAKCMLCLQSPDELIELIQKESTVTVTTTDSTKKKKKAGGKANVPDNLRTMYATSG